MPELNVGLICDPTSNDIDTVIEGPLLLNKDPVTNKIVLSTWNKSKKNC